MASAVIRPEDHRPLAWFACPRCRGALTALRCEACDVTYPRIGGVPLLDVEPEYAVADWRNRWRLERQRLHREALQAESALGQSRGATRTRLQKLNEGLIRQRTAIEHTLAPMLAADRGAARETLLALQTRLPSHHGPSAYANNIARDWVWGQAEIDASLEVLDTLLPEQQPIVQLGSGAGRLAFELGRSRPVLALDSNPLLGLLAHRLGQGESLAFVEFPLAPTRAEDLCITHQLTAPSATTDVTHVIADALNPPLGRGSCPVVLTHWLIDVLDQPLPRIARVINDLLEDGGCWVNQGSLAYASARPEENVLIDEVVELLESAGLQVEHMREDTLPYLQSPYSRQHRSERVLTWCARKTRTVPTSPPATHLPAWLASPVLPVPLLQAFATQSATVRIHAWIMSLIDGKRSLSDIASELERQGLMPRSEAEVAVRGFVTKMYEEMLRTG